MLCPHCKKEELNYIPWLSQFYQCRKCGYMGPVALELTSRAVLETLRRIPRGKVTTYGALGKKFRLHPRTVAKILANNKQPKKYPCYKVVASDGRISGYSGGGQRKKAQLLRKDGIEIKKGKINLEQFGWEV